MVPFDGQPPVPSDLKRWFRLGCSLRSVQKWPQLDYPWLTQLSNQLLIGMDPPRKCAGLCMSVLPEQTQDSCQK